MPVEIERKFLVVNEAWRQPGSTSQQFCQGYLAGGHGVTVRIRHAGSKAYVTIKGKASGSARPEYEYTIPVDEAHELLHTMCRQPLIEKTRHDVLHAGHVWHVDEFGGHNAGLVLAEVELDHVEEEFVRPAWVGAEVTLDLRYRNSALAEAPMGGKGPTQPRQIRKQRLFDAFMKETGWSAADREHSQHGKQVSPVMSWDELADIIAEIRRAQLPDRPPAVATAVPR
jgi:CYTH domain-containing protein